MLEFLLLLFFFLSLGFAYWDESTPFKLFWDGPLAVTIFFILSGRVLVSSYFSQLYPTTKNNINHNNNTNTIHPENEPIANPNTPNPNANANANHLVLSQRLSSAVIRRPVRLGLPILGGLIVYWILTGIFKDWEEQLDMAQEITHASWHTKVYLWKSGEWRNQLWKLLEMVCNIWYIYFLLFLLLLLSNIYYILPYSILFSHLSC